MHRFLQYALRPLARLCLQRGIRVQHFFDAAKRAFVDAATEELNILDSKHSTSRIAAMTGLQRKEIKRLREPNAASLTQVHYLAKILGQWSGNRRFSDRHGKPRVLSLSGQHSEFAELVYSISTDLNPYTALFELERNGAIQKKGTTVRLLHPTMEIGADQESSLQLLAEDIERLVGAVNYNIFDEPQVPNLHSRTEYDNIAPSAIPKIRRWILEQGFKFHTELRAFLSRYDRDLNPSLEKGAGRATVSVGSFSEIKRSAKSSAGGKKK